MRWLAVVFFLLTGAVRTTHGQPVLTPDSGPPGPHLVATGEYKLPASLDTAVLANAKTELWARVFWPQDLSSAQPLVFLLHGNHPTCGELGVHRIDFDCTYTHTGQCPSGHIVVPNHEGFNYLAEHLASWGMIAVTINANRGITCGDGTEGDDGLNLARGRLVLRHLESWRQWRLEGGPPDSLGLSVTDLVNRVDLRRVGLIGHSRGGEGMRAAYNLLNEPNSEWQPRLPEVEIRAIFEIAAVDGQTARILDADNVAWAQLLPMCDGDIAELEGRHPFERMMKKEREAVPTPKSLFMVWGANHNFFNTEWQSSDSVACRQHQPIFSSRATGSDRQRQVAKSAISAFLRTHLGHEGAGLYARTLNPLFPVADSIASITRVDRTHSISADQRFTLRFEEFDQPVGINTLGPANEARGIKIEHQNEGEDSPIRALIAWDVHGEDVYFQSNWSEFGQGRSVATMASLDFRLSLPFNSRLNRVTRPTNFSIALVDSAGRLSEALLLKHYFELQPPPNFRVLTFPTVRIPLADFKGLDLNDVRGVRFIFNRSEKGAVHLAQVRFSAQAEFLAPMTPAAPRFGPMPSRIESSPRSENPAPDRVSRLAARTRVNSPYLIGKKAVEVEVASEEGFPAGPNIPLLIIDETVFSVSRHPEGDLRRLIFSLPASSFERLKEGSPMRVQYGRQTPSRVWDLGPLRKDDQP